MLTKGVIECIIIKSSVERTKEHGKRSVRVEKKLKMLIIAVKSRHKSVDEVRIVLVFFVD